MRSRFRVLAALLALMTLSLSQAGGLWASMCSADMDMAAPAVMADGDAPAETRQVGGSGNSHDERGGDAPECPLIPAGTSSCVGATALPAAADAPSVAPSGGHLSPISPDHAQDLLLANALLRPPRA